MGKSFFLIISVAIFVFGHVSAEGDSIKVSAFPEITCRPSVPADKCQLALQSPIITKWKESNKKYEFQTAEITNIYPSDATSADAISEIFSTSTVNTIIRFEKDAKGKKVYTRTVTPQFALLRRSNVAVLLHVYFINEKQSYVVYFKRFRPAVNSYMLEVASADVTTFNNDVIAIKALQEWNDWAQVKDSSLVVKSGTSMCRLGNGYATPGGLGEHVHLYSFRLVTSHPISFFSSLPPQFQFEPYTEFRKNVIQAPANSFSYNYDFKTIAIALASKSHTCRHVRDIEDIDSVSGGQAPAPLPAFAKVTPPELTYSANIKTAPEEIDERKLATEHNKFQQWYAGISNIPEFKLKSINMDHVAMFRTNPIFILASSVYSLGHRPDTKATLFIRGGSVCVLVILYPCDDDGGNLGAPRVVLTRQARFTTGSEDFVEVLAGMVDDERGFEGPAVKEIGQESGIVVSKSDLKYLTTAYAAPHISDEVIVFFTASFKAKRKAMATYEGSSFGESSEGEYIKTTLVPLGELKSYIGVKPATEHTTKKPLAVLDFKAHIALHAYEMRKFPTPTADDLKETPLKSKTKGTSSLISKSHRISKLRQHHIRDE